jgi:hypothetical protein
MADVKYHSIALAGSGSVDAGTATKLLNDWLPKNLGATLRPGRIPRKQATLNAIVNWLELPNDIDEGGENDTLGPDGTKASEDLIADLLKLRDEDGDEVTLVYLLPEATEETPIPEAELALLKAAFDAGITVKNLAGAGALDDIDPDEIFPPEPEPEVPAEQVAEAANEWGKGVEGNLPQDVTPAVAVALGAGFGPTLAGLIEQFVRTIVQDELSKHRPDVQQTERKTDAVVAKDVIAATAARLAEPKPPFDPPFVSEAGATSSPDSERIKYYVTNDAQGNPVSYRKAQTRPRNGEDPIMLTLDEIDDLVQRGMIDESSTADKKPTRSRRATTR